jgi:hypothetical protein
MGLSDRSLAGRPDGAWVRSSGPVKWAHHPPEVKAAIRRASFVPRIKQCFANCQRLVLYGGLEGAVYHEGVVRRPGGAAINHGWIIWRGRLVDLTLRDADPVAGYAVPTDVVRNVVFGRAALGVIYEDRLIALLRDATC